MQLDFYMNLHISSQKLKLGDTGCWHRIMSWNHVSLAHAGLRYWTMDQDETKYTSLCHNFIRNTPWWCEVDATKTSDLTSNDEPRHDDLYMEVLATRLRIDYEILDLCDCTYFGTIVIKQRMVTLLFLHTEGMIYFHHGYIMTFFVHIFPNYLKFLKDLLVFSNKDIACYTS